MLFWVTRVYLAENASLDVHLFFDLFTYQGTVATKMSMHSQLLHRTNRVSFDPRENEAQRDNEHVKQAHSR